MSQKEKQLILKLARQVRRWVLRQYKNSSGACFDASMKLAELLNKHGIVNHVIKGRFRTEYGELLHHWWIVVERLILDVTADQFIQMIEGKVHIPAVVFSSNRAMGNRYVADR